MSRQSTYDAVLPAPFGALGVQVTGNALTGLEFLPAGTMLREAEAPLVRQVARELAAYFADHTHAFALPTDPSGTDFRRRVWLALMQIPAGQTVTYGELARRVGSSPRAVGQAVGDNPIPIVIPCHRVVAAGGGLGGFMHSRTGYSLDIKRWLLGHEQVPCR